MSKSGATWSFTYDADGLRTKRTDNSTTYSYVYNGGSLSSMTVGSNTLYFSYDASGTPVSVTYNGTAYYYATNLQGDVTAILNSSGTAVVSYTYDAWGRPLTTTGDLASTLGAHNPLRYRGYVYDTETGLYYLQSRYYNPEISRFSVPDIVYDTDAGLQGYDLFVYCGNNPVNRIDISGADSTDIDNADITDDQIDNRENGKTNRSSRSIPANNHPRSRSSNKNSSISSNAKKGTQNSKVQQAIQRGQEKHKNQNYRSGVDKEKTIGSNNRVDGLDRSNQIIYELKPNNYRAIIRGQTQLIRYTTAACAQFGGIWIGILITYD